jgi:hypothetical protein
MFGLTGSLALQNNRARGRCGNTTSPDYQKGVELRAREFKAVVKFYEEAKPIFGPYIRAHQRADAGGLLKAQ